MALSLLGRSLTVPNGPEIVAHAPPGVNPYSYFRAFIEAILIPSLPDAFFVNLILLSVLLSIGAVLSVAVLVMPFRQGGDSVERNLWLVKRKVVVGCEFYNFFVYHIYMVDGYCFAPRPETVLGTELRPVVCICISRPLRGVQNLHLVSRITLQTLHTSANVYANR